jgi:hypothetical protein
MNSIFLAFSTRDWEQSHWWISDIQALDTLSLLMLGLTGVSMGYKEIFTAGRSSVKLLWSDGACWIFSQLGLGVARRASCVRPTHWGGGSPSRIGGEVDLVSPVRQLPRRGKLQNQT